VYVVDQEGLSTQPSIYEEIGADLVRRCLTVFYERAFTDGVIGHFFFGKDRAHITEQQIDFATAMLGGPRKYRGKPLAVAHAHLDIRRPHFLRRQVLMREVLNELGVPERCRNEWLALEEALRPVVTRPTKDLA